MRGHPRGAGRFEVSLSGAASSANACPTRLRKVVWRLPGLGSQAPHLKCLHIAFTGGPEVGHSEEEGPGDGSSQNVLLGNPASRSWALLSGPLLCWGQGKGRGWGLGGRLLMVLSTFLSGGHCKEMSEPTQSPQQPRETRREGSL